MATITEEKQTAAITEETQIPEQKQSPLDAVIEQAKKDLEQLFAKRRQVIRNLGKELEKVAEDPSDVCRQIKAHLREEIGKKLVSGKDIERYCYEKWKKKTKPKKNDKKSIPEELLGETFTIPAEKFGAVIEAIRLSKKGCSLRFNKNYELVSVQAD